MRFGTGLPNTKTFVSEVDMLSDLRMFLSSFFHSDIASGKKNFFKKLLTNSKLQKAITISSLVVLVRCGISVKQKAWRQVFQSFEKTLKFPIYDCLCRKVSKPNTR